MRRARTSMANAYARMEQRTLRAMARGGNGRGGAGGSGGSGG